MTTPTYGPSYGEPTAAPTYGTPYPVQPGQPGQPGQYERPVGPPPSKAKAYWALGLGWFPFFLGWVVAVVLACVVITRSGDGRNHGKRIAIWGLVGVGFWVAVIVAVFVFRPLAAHRDSAGDVTKAGSMSVVALRVGDCGQQPPSGPTSVVHVVPCAQPHAFQVLATFELSGDYPGDSAVSQESESGCEQRLSGMTQLRGRSDLRLTLLHPLASVWQQNKTVVCMATSDQPTTGSLLAGAGVAS
jgi:hypothetical protein